MLKAALTVTDDRAVPEEVSLAATGAQKEEHVLLEPVVPNRQEAMEACRIAGAARGQQADRAALAWVVYRYAQFQGCVSAPVPMVPAA